MGKVVFINSTSYVFVVDASNPTMPSTGLWGTTTLKPEENQEVYSCGLFERWPLFLIARSENSTSNKNKVAEFNMNTAMFNYRNGEWIFIIDSTGLYDEKKNQYVCKWDSIKMYQRRRNSSSVISNKNNAGSSNQDQNHENNPILTELVIVRV